MIVLYIQAVISTNECYYYEFLCPENENEICIFLNITMWNIEKEKINDQYTQGIYKTKKYRPILKMCDKQEVDLKSCDTESCQEDNDCYSGKCYNNNYITDKTIYLCSGFGHLTVQ